MTIRALGSLSLKEAMQLPEIHLGQEFCFPSIRGGEVFVSKNVCNALHAYHKEITAMARHYGHDVTTVLRDGVFILCKAINERSISRTAAFKFLHYDVIEMHLKVVDLQVK